MPLCDCEMCWADSEAVLGVWLPAPLPTPRALPDHGAIWPLAVGVETDLGGNDVWPCGIVCCSLCGLTHPPSIAMSVSMKRVPQRGWARRAGRRLAFTRYSFTSSRLCTNQSSFQLSGPPALTILLQYYCTTIGQYTTPPRPPLCMPYTLQYWE